MLLVKEQMLRRLQGGIVLEGRAKVSMPFIVDEVLAVNLATKGGQIYLAGRNSVLVEAGGKLREMVFGKGVVSLEEPHYKAKLGYFTVG